VAVCGIDKKCAVFYHLANNVSVALYNTGALISINSCLTNAQMILN